MSIKGTAIKLALVSIILALCSALLIVVFGQLRFQRFSTCEAEFSNGKRSEGRPVRAGRRSRGRQGQVGASARGRAACRGPTQRRQVAAALPIDRRADRYANLIGERYVNLDRGTGEGMDRVLPPGGLIPLARTQPALDLDA